MSNKKPTALKKLQGNPGKRPLPEGEPLPSKGTQCPRKPPGMTYAAGKAWDKLAKPMWAAGLLTEADVFTFRIMLEHWAVFIEAKGIVHRDGLMDIDEQGVRRKHPMLQVMRDNSAAFRSYAAEFGLSPRARTGIKVQNDDGSEEDLAASIFKLVNT